MDTHSAPYKWDFFIAHAGCDQAAAEDLYDRLNNGSRVFLSTRCLALGDDWDVKLRQAQQNSIVTVVLISAATDLAYYQREEIAAAIALARRNGGHRVVPVYLNGEAAIADSIPYGLRLKHGITLSDSVGLNDLSELLLGLLKRLQAGGDGAVGEAIRSNRSSDLLMIIDVMPDANAWEPAASALSYQLDRLDASLRVRPSMEYLEKFQNGGPIEPLTGFSWNFPNLDVKVINNGHRTVFLTEVCFDIAVSCLDPSPILVIDAGGGPAKRQFLIRNEGWGEVRNLRARFYLTPLVVRQQRQRPGQILDHAYPPKFQEPYPYEAVVGDFSEFANVNISPFLEAEGVDLDALDSLPIAQEIGHEYDDGTYFAKKGGREQIVTRSELDELRAACLGKFRTAVVNVCTDFVSVSGELVFETLTEQGSREHRVKFSTAVDITERWAPRAAAPPTYQYAAKFDVNGRNYQRRVPISHVLKPGEADRFNIFIGMEKSSRHSFITKLIYNNGPELVSPNLELFGFVPRSAARDVSLIESPAMSRLQAIGAAVRFNPEGFRGMYERIAGVFAAGDRQTLEDGVSKRYLSHEAYEDFEAAIRARRSLDDHVQFVPVGRPELIGAELRGNTAEITVRFVSRAVSLRRDNSGQVDFFGDEKVTEVTDIWTYGRDMADRSAPWTLMTADAGPNSMFRVEEFARATPSASNHSSTKEDQLPRGAEQKPRRIASIIRKLLRTRFPG